MIRASLLSDHFDITFHYVRISSKRKEKFLKTNSAFDSAYLVFSVSLHVRSLFSHGTAQNIWLRRIWHLVNFSLSLDRIRNITFKVESEKKWSVQRKKSVSYIWASPCEKVSFRRTKSVIRLCLTFLWSFSMFFLYFMFCITSPHHENMPI